MAARENQGLQIALIIFVILTLMLISATYYFFSNWQKEKEINKDLTAKNQKLDADAKKANGDSDEFKAWIGAATTDKKEDVATKFKHDLETYGKGLPDTNQNYQGLVEFLNNELKNANKRTTELAAARKGTVRKDQGRRSDQERRDRQVHAATRRHAQGHGSGGARSSRKIATRSTRRRTSWPKRPKALVARYDDLMKKTSDQINSVTNEKDHVVKLLQDKNNEDMRKQKANEVADGKINWINQRTRIVWINLGSSDGLRRQTSFSVFDQDAVNPLENDRKGKIEVVRLMDAHQAESADRRGRSLQPAHAGRSDLFAHVGAGPARAFCAGRRDGRQPRWRQRSAAHAQFDHAQRRRDRRRSQRRRHDHRPHVDQDQVSRPR